MVLNTHLILNREIDEVSIDQNPVRRPQSSVVFEEKRRRNIWPKLQRQYNYAQTNKQKQQIEKDLIKKLTHFLVAFLW